MKAKIKLWFFRTGKRLSHKGEHFFHITYLGMVGAQAEHEYRYAAWALLVFVVVNVFVGGESE